jgi:hypothetical protein
MFLASDAVREVGTSGLSLLKGLFIALEGVHTFPGGGGVCCHSAELAAVLCPEP